MTVLDRTVRFEQVIANGARDAYSQRHPRKWFGDVGSIALKQALKTKTNAGRVLWPIMREEFLPAPSICACCVGSVVRPASLTVMRCPSPPPNSHGSDLPWQRHGGHVLFFVPDRFKPLTSYSTF